MMNENAELLKLVPLATPLVSTLVDLFVKPKLEKFSRFLKGEKAVSVISVENKFREYLNRTYEKNSYLTILAFQNQRRKLSEIYVPLEIVDEIGGHRLLIDKYDREFFSKHQKLLISDT